MSGVGEIPNGAALYEASEQDRQQLIGEMDRLHDTPHSRLAFAIKSRQLAKRALLISRREEVYPMQAYDLASRVAALNPRLGERAHVIITEKFATKKDMPLPVAALTHAALEKTVEKSLNNDDDTIPLPRLAATASLELAEQHIDEMEASDAQKAIADAHERAARDETFTPAGIDAPTGASIPPRARNEQPAHQLVSAA